VDVNHHFRQVRQQKLQKNVTRHRKEQIHIEKELAVEINRLMSMTAEDIEKEKKYRLLMEAVENIEIEEEDQGELKRF
jgi:hypothetical protein